MKLMSEILTPEDPREEKGEVVVSQLTEQERILAQVEIVKLLRSGEDEAEHERLFKECSAPFKKLEKNSEVIQLIRERNFEEVASLLEALRAGNHEEVFSRLEELELKRKERN